LQPAKLATAPQGGLELVESFSQLVADPINAVGGLGIVIAELVGYLDLGGGDGPNRRTGGGEVRDPSSLDDQRRDQDVSAHVGPPSSSDR
jgi:hypothetical protein